MTSICRNCNCELPKEISSCEIEPDLSNVKPNVAAPIEKCDCWILPNVDPTVVPTVPNVDPTVVPTVPTLPDMSDYTKPPAAIDCDADKAWAEKYADSDLKINRVRELHQACLDEYKQSIYNNRELKQTATVSNARIEELTECLAAVRAQIEVLKKEIAQVKSERDMARIEEGNVMRKYWNLASKHELLKYHFDIIAKGFASLNEIVKSRCSDESL